MGYYTRYSINFQDIEARYSSYSKMIEDIRNTAYFLIKNKKISFPFLVIKEEFSYEFDNLGKVEEKENPVLFLREETGELKWYEHEDDLRDLSSRLPGILIELYGEGEEAGDIWKKYFYNGKVQRTPARIEFDSFDETQLR